MIWLYTYINDKDCIYNVISYYVKKNNLHGDMKSSTFSLYIQLSTLIIVILWHYYIFPEKCNNRTANKDELFIWYWNLFDLRTENKSNYLFYFGYNWFVMV